MYKITNLLILSCFVLLLTCQTASAAWPWSKTPDLVTINGSPYTADDYMHWWDNRSGRHKGTHDIQEFVEWKLLVQEALSMELDQSSSIKRKNEVYLGVHRRMQFKMETVDSKIRISEQDRKERFDAEFNPVSFFTFLYFKSAEKAQEALQSLKNGNILFEDLKNIPESEGGVHQSRQYQYFPRRFERNPRLKEIIGGIQVGDLSQVFPAGKLFVLARFDKQEAPDAGLYQVRKKDIHNRMVKELRNRFTSELVNSLWQKYEVQINEDLFAQASVDMEGDILGQPIFTTNKAGIPLALLVKDMRKEHALRKVEEWPEEQRVKLYRGLLNGMIIEYLFIWESIERRYEDKPPFKWTYEYHQEKNLIKELEKLVLEPRVSVPEDEIVKYYQEHIDNFKDPDLVTFAILDAKKNLVERIWQEVSRGGDIFEVARKHKATLFPLEDIEVGKLSPEIGAALQKLDIDEVSPPFQGTKDRLKLVVLLDRTVGKIHPLESVKKEVIKKLWPEKFQLFRSEYIKKILAYSEIETNQKGWKKLIADQKK